MRTLVIIALLAALCAACADEPAKDATPAGPTWLTDRPENAHPYAAETLARFEMLVEGDDWRDAAWNAQGTLEVTHEKTGLGFIVVPGGKAVDPEHAWPWELEDNSIPAFLICKTECTERAWRKGGGAINPHHDEVRDLPVEYLRWENCQTWCQMLGLRLPTSSEMSYVWRAGPLQHVPFEDDVVVSYVGPVRALGDLKKMVAPHSWGLIEFPGHVEVWARGEPDGRARAAHWLLALSGLDVLTREERWPGFRPAADLPE
jgi:hypothetical protein